MTQYMTSVRLDWIKENCKILACDENRDLYDLERASIFGTFQSITPVPCIKGVFVWSNKDEYFIISENNVRTIYTKN